MSGFRPVHCTVCRKVQPSYRGYCRVCNPPHVLFRHQYAQRAPEHVVVPGEPKRREQQPIVLEICIICGYKRRKHEHGFWDTSIAGLKRFWHRSCRELFESKKADLTTAKPGT